MVEDLGVRPPDGGQAAADDARPRPSEHAAPAAVQALPADDRVGRHFQRTHCNRLSTVSCPVAPRAAGMAPVRVLCLHSFRMSGGSLRKQMCEFSNFAASLGEQCEFRFLDGPHRCPPEKEAQMPARLKALLPPPYFEWWNARESDDGVVSYDGEGATLAHVTDFMLREGVTPQLTSPHLPLLACSPLLRLLRAPSAPLRRRSSPHRRTPRARPVRRRARLQSGRQLGAPAVHGAGPRQGTRARSERRLGRSRSLLPRPPGTRGFGLGCSASGCSACSGGAPGPDRRAEPQPCK